MLSPLYLKAAIQEFGPLCPISLGKEGWEKKRIYWLNVLCLPSWTALRWAFHLLIHLIFTIILGIGIILPILQMRNPRLSEVTCLSKVTRRYSVGAGFKPRPVSAKRAPDSSITPFWKVSQFFVLTRCPAQDSLGDASKPKIISLPRLLSALWFCLVLPLGTLLYS